MARRFDGTAKRPAAVELRVDGVAVAGIPGESLATALLAAGRPRFRTSPGRGEPRGPFCFMGVCQECLLMVNGRRVQACLEPVRAGMVVETGMKGTG